MKKEELTRCNLDYLYELARGDMDFIKEMVTVFLEEIIPELETLGKQIRNSDFSGIKQLSHKLRSSIPYVGLDTVIGEDLADMEDLARDHLHLSRIQVHFQKVRSVCDAAVKELRLLEI
jgi:HPt (histidine-containing phosphotransfer) domain-containing protein